MRIWFHSVAICAIALVVSGCTYDRHDAIPPDAMTVTEGQTELAYVAPESGRFYVFNASDNRMIFVGDVERNQRIMVDNRQNKITVDGRVVAEPNLDDGHKLKVFFDDELETVDKLTVERETRIEK
ncbi:MAG: hypothetical protein ACREIT_08400 [Tepidisphaeraceae bacterium]